MSPSFGIRQLPKAHRKRTTVSPEHTITPLKTFTSAMKNRNTVKGFLKQWRGSLYNTNKTKAFGSPMIKNRDAKGIPLPRHSDLSESRSMTGRLCTT